MNSPIGNYPYAEVTPMAIKLWKHFRPDIKIYIKLIYTKTPEVLAPLRKLYEENLKEAGADEIEWSYVKDAGNISCVLQSQLSRLFLYQKPYINPTGTET